MPIDINSFDPLTLLMLGALNPATIAVAFMMGRHADQPQKLLIAALAAALAGFILYWLSAHFGIFQVHALGGEAGMILVATLAGLVWASLGYFSFRAKA